jgi:hypothetical protein
VITGVYQPERGPYLMGVLRLAEPVARSLEVSFLIDTGAALTSLLPTDVLRLTPTEVQLLPEVLRAEDIAVRGIGGSVSRWTTPASLLFIHDSGDQTVIRLDVTVMLDTSLAGLPSLLGRDVLGLGRLHADGPRQLVEFDISLGEFDL